MTVVAPERSRERVQEREVVPSPTIEKALRDTMEMLHEKATPIIGDRDEVASLFTESTRNLVDGETGSGKSTVSPVIALAVAESEAIDGMPGKVVVTQPRRVAAESLYKFLAPTMGDRVGFRHGGGSSITENTRLEFAVERSLLNDIVRSNDPLLLQYNTIIVDEVHEGTVDSEILLPLLKGIQIKRRETGAPPLKVVIASATLDKKTFEEWFVNEKDPDGPPLRSIKVEGRMFDVSEHFETEKVDIRDVEKVAAQRAIEVFDRGQREPGDMLIFMPGAAEIRKTVAALEELKQAHGISDDEIEFVSLMGGAESAESMRKIYETSTKRRIFIATNVAETSITIPSVRVVIDSGLMRFNYYDPETGMSGLRTDVATKSNARQRKGRAGRVSEGTVHYLFTKEDFDSRKEFLPPEILRTDLVTQVLLMKELGIKDILDFDFIHHPGKNRIEQAVRSLEFLGALNKDGTLNETGRLMAQENAEPRFARMLVEAQRLGIKDDVALVVGMMMNARYDLINRDYNLNDPIFAQYISHNSDILTRLNIWNEYVAHNNSKTERERWEAETKFRTVGFYKASTTRQEILRDRAIKDRPVDLSPENLAKIYQSIAVGFVDNFVVRKDGVYQTLNGTGGIQIDRNSVLKDVRPSSFVSGSLRKTERGIYAGFNFTYSLENLKRIAPYLENAFSAPEEVIKVSEVTKASTPKIEDEIDVIAQQIDRATFVPLLQTKEELNETENLTRMEKIKESVRSFLRKLHLIN